MLLDHPFWVGTPTGDSPMVTAVYRCYVVSVNDRDSLVNLMVLDNVDFDVILGMD